eukprot:1159099-Pelagomonas_calceolata.AAC.6
MGLSCKGKGQGGVHGHVGSGLHWAHLQCRSFGLSRNRAILWPKGVQSLAGLFPGSSFLQRSIVLGALAAF